MDKGKIAKITCAASTTAFIITLTSYTGLKFMLQSIEIYCLGIATLALLFPFLLSIAYVMAATANHALERGIMRLRDQEESKLQTTEDKLT